MELASNMRNPSINPEDNVLGKSPLGGNSVDGGNIEGVPLFWDNRVDNFISEQAIEELDDRDMSLARREEFTKEESFLTKIGYRKG